MRELLGITPLEAVAVVLATVGMYAALVVLVRLLGQRMLAGLSAFDLAAIIGIGSIMGRAALGEAPHLAGGIIALATLAGCQLATSRIGGWGARAITTRPVVLMAGSQVVERNLRRCRIAPHELAGRLRQAGIRNVDEVAMAVLEPSGTISVTRRGTDVSPFLLDGVDGADLVRKSLGRTE
ncbi:DUF421 domain-containing protein [Myceligenerans indicum]|uniref:DUF421 domain-containing protein n=1 Tax=Myceligenerans indicum TaxID=2593663 RepID=A0ABS1LP00_9MICO|nr:YetF domain-containing protein [Myceligenerans indicum]MBL0887739.1 DUF421 domain-containing protein [Myceligenerans indicum]